LWRGWDRLRDDWARTREDRPSNELFGVGSRDLGRLEGENNSENGGEETDRTKGHQSLH